MNDDLRTLRTLLDAFKEASVRILALPLEGEGSPEADQSLQRLQAEKSGLAEEIDHELALRGSRKLPQELRDLGMECRDLEERIQAKLTYVSEDIGTRIQRFSQSRRMYSSYVGEHAPSSGFFIDSQS